MGLGKTFEGSEMLMHYDNKINLIVCQKSKIDDWYNHFKDYYSLETLPKIITSRKEFNEFISFSNVSYEFDFMQVGIINYDLIFRRPELLELKDFTLLLDESSNIKNEHCKRGKFILKLKPKNVILLTGTPMNGKFEELWSQLKLLGWSISRELFDNQYLEYKIDRSLGFPRKIRIGYKNKERLLRKLHDYGGIFRKTEEVFNLPEKIHQIISIEPTKEYKEYQKTKVVTIKDKLFVGDIAIGNRINERELCGSYSKNKLQAYEDLIDSSNDRFIVFYNFNDELDEMIDL